MGSDKMYVMPTSKMEKTIKENGDTEALLDGLLECVSALKCIDREELEKIVAELRQPEEILYTPLFSDSKWAVGEMLQRIIYFLGNTGGFVSD
jgi:hypothetical protein